MESFSVTKKVLRHIYIRVNYPNFKHHSHFANEQ